MLDNSRCEDTITVEYLPTRAEDRELHQSSRQKCTAVKKTGNNRIAKEPSKPFDIMI